MDSRQAFGFGRYGDDAAGAVCVCMHAAEVHLVGAVLILMYPRLQLFEGCVATYFTPQPCTTTVHRISSETRNYGDQLDFVELQYMGYLSIRICRTN